jgi:hypothetical protein
VYLADNGDHYTHFTGFMLEEDIASSLWKFQLKEHPKCENRPWRHGLNFDPIIEKYITSGRK